MAIKIKSGGASSAAVVGSYAGGRGKRAAEDTRLGFQTLMQEESKKKDRLHQSFEKSIDRAHQSSESALGRSHAATQANLQRTWQSGEAARGRKFQAAEAEKNRQVQAELARQRTWAGQVASLDAGVTARNAKIMEQFAAVNQENPWREKMELASQLKSGELEFELSAKQKDDFNRTFSALDEARESGNFTDDEMKELEQQAYSKLAGLSYQPKLKDKSPYPEGQQPGQVWTSPDGNYILTRDSKGDIKKLGESRDKPTFNDRNAAWKLALEIATEPVLTSKGIDTGQKKINYDRARDIVEEILGQQGEAADWLDTKMRQTGFAGLMDEDSIRDMNLNVQSGSAAVDSASLPVDEETPETKPAPKPVESREDAKKKWGVKAR